MSLQSEDYISFMAWFKENYPQLYRQYGHNITMAKGSEGVSIKGENIPAQTFEEILQIQYEYYSTRN